MSLKSSKDNGGRRCMERLYEVLVESVDDVVFVVGRDGRYEMFNERGMDRLGLDRKNTVGRIPSELFGESAGLRMEARNRKVMESGKPLVQEEWLTIGQNNYCFSTSLAPIFDEKGKVAGVVGIARDVTEIKHMTEEIDAYAREMESMVDQRVRYERLVAELTQEAMKRQKLDDFFDAMIRRTGEALGVSRSYLFEYDGKRQRVTSIHEWIAPGIKSMKYLTQNIGLDSQPWAAGQLLAGESICIEDVRNAPSPEFKELLEKFGVKSVLILPISAFGNPYGFLAFDECVLHRHWEDVDIDLLKSVGRIISQTIERTRLEDEIIRTEKLAATGRLAASLAHEINNPLQGVLLHLEAVYGHVEKGKERNLEYIREGFQRISKIVSRLLDLHRGAQKTEDVNINKVLKDSFNLVASQLDHRGCTVNWNLEEALPGVRGDATQLHQVFLNILLNALDSMKNGGALRILTSRSVDGVAIDIDDTGAGIDEERLPYLFEPFYSDKREHGAGLGLFVSHSIVSDHGGRIEVSSRKGAGTNVRVMLPASKPRSASRN
ncbi:MAG: ATP-binding protein [Pseudomonadota bacterium]